MIPLLFAALAAGAPPMPRTANESDYQRVVTVGSPVLSHDAKTALVLVSRIDWNDDTRDAQLVAIDLTTRAQRILVAGRKGLSDPSFSPNDATVAFIADAGTGSDAHGQIFTEPAAGGTPQQITTAKSGVEQYAWRPDSAAIAFASADSAADRTGADRFRDSFVFTTQPIVDRDPPHSVHLFLVPATGGTARQLTFGTRTVAAGEAESTLSWSPDGTRIAFVSAPDPVLNDESYSRITILDIASGRTRLLTGNTAWETNPLWSPDGRHIAYEWSSGDPQVNLNQVYVTTPAGGRGVCASRALDRNAESVAWDSDSRALYVATPTHTTTALYRIALAGGVRHLDVAGLVPQSALDDAVGRDGTLVFVGSAVTRAPELYERTPSGSVVRLTAFNAALDSLALGRARTISFSTTTGIRGDGVLLTPPHFSAHRRYPLVVYIHGGPTSSSATGFSLWAQVMAARGWLVLEPNYRGSDNLGLAYQRAVLYDPEAGPGADIMAAVNAVKALGIVDSRRIAVCGWSYGGIMTAWMISRYHIWAAAVSGASVDDWITDYGTADDSLADVDLFHGSPFVGNNAAEWNRASAIWYARDVTTPVLILSDVGDNRDPFATSSMYWRALRDNHKTATLRVWPVNGHFPSDPVRQADVYHYWIGFIAQHFR